MAFIGLFTVTQGTDISRFTLTDSSTNFDTNITTRTVYIYKTDGTIWASANWPKVAGVGDAIIFTSMDKDYSFSVVVVWSVPSPGVGGVYTKNEIVTFVGYSNNFIYTIIQQMAANPVITSDENFMVSLSNIQTFVDSAIQSTNFSDQFNAQSNLDRVYYIQGKQQLYF